MADPTLLVYVVFGALAGVTTLTGFPYFMLKKGYEEKVAAINAKPISERTDEEKYLLENPPGGFWATYKYRFGFGLLVGLGTSIATIEGTFAQLPADASALTAFVSGMTASGFFTAIANAIRDTPK